MTVHIPRLILEINTRVWIRQLGLGPSPSFREIPTAVIAEWKRGGFDAVWLMGVWLPSPKAREMALAHAGLHGEYLKVLPDLHDEDVAASPYAIRGYQVNPEWGGNEALLDFRARLNEQGIKLLLDFVPNHVARDHPWIYDHPERFVQGFGELFHKAPQNWFFAETKDGEKIIAHGRDPYFDGWSDTAQLDYRNPDLQRAQLRELLDVASLCDGVRCDMAMLLLGEVFSKTWSVTPPRAMLHFEWEEFWPLAIREVKALHPEFCFIAEAYWGLEPKLTAQGFDLCYDKEHLDHVVGEKPLTRALFDLDFTVQQQRVRFLENHDEPRIASRLAAKKHACAAAWTFCLPGSRLLYDGQMAGKKVRIPVQLLREPRESLDEAVHAAYEKLLQALQRPSLRTGEWKLLSPRTAWMGNETHQVILGMSWDQQTPHEHTRVFVNGSENRSQCWVDIGLGQLAAKEVVLTDVLTGKIFVRSGVELMMRGLYLDMEPWEAHIFDCAIRSDTNLTLD